MLLTPEKKESSRDDGQTEVFLAPKETSRENPEAQKELESLEKDTQAADEAALEEVRKTIEEKEPKTPEEGLLSVRQRLEDFLATVKNLTLEEAKNWSDQAVNQIGDIMNAAKRYAKELHPREEMENILESIQRNYGQAIGELTKKLGPGFLNRFIGTIQEGIGLVNQRLNEIREIKKASVKETPQEAPEKNESKGFFAKIKGLFRRKQ